MPPVRLGSRGALTSALLPLGYVAVPFLLGLSTGPAEVSDRSWLLLSGLYLGFIGRLALKDFRDQRGDSLYGKRTFLVRYGRTSTARFGAAFMLLGGLVTAAAVPKASWATWACVGVQLTAATWLLRRVARDRHGVDDRANILALAILGRLLLVVVLLQCWGSTHGWSTHLTSALVSLATVLCLAIAAHRWRTSRSFELGDPADLAALPPPRVHRPATIPR
jgi:4-hydroxybenzoate polyprenyltransferase